MRHSVVARDATCVPSASRRVYLRVANAPRPTVVGTDDDVEPANTPEHEDEDDLHEPDDETEEDIEIVPDLANR